MKGRQIERRAFLMCAALFAAVAAFAEGTRMLDVSGADSRYFADESGKTFVPVGCNICFPRMYVAGSPDSRAECEAKLFGWLRAFAANGGPTDLRFSRRLARWNEGGQSPQKAHFAGGSCVMPLLAAFGRGGDGMDVPWLG